MKKIIDIPDEILKDLKILAVYDEKSLKKFIELHLVKLVKNPDNTGKRNLLIDFASYVNKNELSESSEKITDDSIKQYLRETKQDGYKKV